MPILNISLSPHVHGSDSIEHNMYGVVIALIPALIVSFFYFGIGAAIVCTTSILSCVLVEYVINKYLLHNECNTIKDGSAIVTGLLLGFNLPSNLPVWIVLVGAIVAIGIGKMTFGGLGCNLFNPALVGRCFLLVSFPTQMTSWPVEGQLVEYTDATTAATPLSIMKAAIKSRDASLLDSMPDYWHLFIGNPGINHGAGSIGEVCALALLAGLVFLLWKRILTYHITFSILITVYALSGLLHIADKSYADPVMTILSGGLLFGAIFMATDYVTSPMTHKGQIIYGISIGLLTVVIRNWGAYPEGMSFAILIMNAFTPLINIYFKPKRFGIMRTKKGGYAE